MKNNISLLIAFTICTLLVFSCTDDLNQNPTDPDLFTEVDVYSLKSVKYPLALIRVF